MTDWVGNTWGHTLRRIPLGSTRCKCYANCDLPVVYEGTYKRREKSGRVTRQRRCMCYRHALMWRKKYRPKELTENTR